MTLDAARAEAEVRRMVREGYSVRQVIAKFPSLTAEDVRAINQGSGIATILAQRAAPQPAAREVPVSPPRKPDVGDRVLLTPTGRRADWTGATVESVDGNSVHLKLDRQTRGVDTCTASFWEVLLPEQEFAHLPVNQRQLRRRLVVRALIGAACSCYLLSVLAYVGGVA